MKLYRYITISHSSDPSLRWISTLPHIIIAVAVSEAGNVTDIQMQILRSERCPACLKVLYCILFYLHFPHFPVPKESAPKTIPPHYVFIGSSEAMFCKIK